MDETNGEMSEMFWHLSGFMTAIFEEQARTCCLRGFLVHKTQKKQVLSRSPYHVKPTGKDTKCRQTPMDTQLSWGNPRSLISAIVMFWSRSDSLQFEVTAGITLCVKNLDAEMPQRHITKECCPSPCILDF